MSFKNGLIMKNFLRILALTAVVVLCVQCAARRQGGVVEGITITGKVTDCEGQPIRGATVFEEGRPFNGTASNSLGEYTLTVQDAKAVLVFSFIGFEIQKIKVGNKTKIDVPLKDSDAVIEEVIIRDFIPIRREAYIGKPVIYLYPERVTDISVKVDFDGEMQFTYPDYGSGWHVTASPDGSLVNKADGRQYSYLFWDGVSYPATTEYETGYVVHRDNVTGFLQKILPRYGLLPREYNEFIVYWAPQMKKNEWNFIHFRSGAEYDAISKNTVTPHPQTEIRVFMDFAGVDGPFEVAPQIPTAPVRRGFTLVEWGGREVDFN